MKYSKDFYYGLTNKNALIIVPEILRYVKPKSVLDVGCFIKGTLINTSIGYNPIEEIEIGDIVITHKNNEYKVIKTFKRTCNSLIKVNIFGREIITTSNHPFLTMPLQRVKHCGLTWSSCNTNNKKYTCSGCKKQRYGEPEWIESNKLKVGDFLCIPRNCFGTKNKKILASLLGYYLSEGSMIYSHPPHFGGLCFTFNIKEKKYAKEVKKLALALNATSVTEDYRKNKNVLEVRVYGKDLANKIYSLGGKNSHNKKINLEEINKWNKNSIINLLRTYYLGDGHYGWLEKKGACYSAKTASYDLMNGIKYLFIKLGILPTISKCKGSSGNDCYSIDIHGTDINLLIKNKIKYASHKRYRVNKSFIFLPILNIEKLNTEEYVYNLEVENDNSYLVYDIAVHNCGVGHWLSVFKNYGIENIKGIDGHYVPIDEIVIPEKDFVRRDLSEGLSLQHSQFDLILCLEVMEHLPSDQAEPIIKRLTELSPIIIFSAAIPGQGGTHHINEHWQSYWEHIFNKYNYYRIDCLRPVLWERDVECCYKQNMFFYVDKNKLKDYPELKVMLETTSYIPTDIVHPTMYRHEDLRSIPLKRALGTILFLPYIIMRTLRSYYVT